MAGTKDIQILTKYSSVLKRMLDSREFSEGAMLEKALAEFRLFVDYFKQNSGGRLINESAEFGVRTARMGDLLNLCNRRGFDTTDYATKYEDLLKDATEKDVTEKKDEKTKSYCRHDLYCGDRGQWNRAKLERRFNYLNGIDRGLELLTSFSVIIKDDHDAMARFLAMYDLFKENLREYMNAKRGNQKMTIAMKKACSLLKIAGLSYRGEGKTHETLKTRRSFGRSLPKRKKNK